jgi:hypothetical protein
MAKILHMPKKQLSREVPHRFNHQDRIHHLDWPSNNAVVYYLCGFPLDRDKKSARARSTCPKEHC